MWRWVHTKVRVKSDHILVRPRLTHCLSCHTIIPCDKLVHLFIVCVSHEVTPHMTKLISNLV